MQISDKRTYIVAELSANHKQDKMIALESVVAAAHCGVDAIKIQTYTPDTLTIDCDNEYFRIQQGTIWDGQTLYNLYRDAYTPWEWQYEIKKRAEECGIDFFSSPFDKTSVDFLEELGVSAFKIASFEINDLELIDYICLRNKPVLISTGVATLAEILHAVEICRYRGIEPVLLHCTSSYPARPSQMNLAMIQNMKATFGTRVGLSDHTVGSAVAIAAVALGASVVEKHFILNKTLGGPDASFSMEPDDFKKMVDAIRMAEEAMGSVNYSIGEEKAKARKFMRSLFSVEDIQAGEAFSRSNVRAIRPGDGLPPAALDEVIGRKAATQVPRGTPLTWKLIK